MNTCNWTHVLILPIMIKVTFLAHHEQDYLTYGLTFSFAFKVMETHH